jgi:hypothetical protein
MPDHDRQPDGMERVCKGARSWDVACLSGSHPGRPRCEWGQGPFIVLAAHARIDTSANVVMIHRDWG